MCINKGLNIFSLSYYIEIMFCLLLTNPTFNSFGCHGNQGVNTGDMAVLEIYRRHHA